MDQKVFQLYHSLADEWCVSQMTDGPLVNSMVTRSERSFKTRAEAIAHIRTETDYRKLVAYPIGGHSENAEQAANRIKEFYAENSLNQKYSAKIQCRYDSIICDFESEFNVYRVHLQPDMVTLAGKPQAALRPDNHWAYVGAKTE